MYCLNEEQIEFILNDIKFRGVEMEDLQSNLLDHICCIIEKNLEANGDFEKFYSETIQTFYKKELREIEEETKFLLKFKNYYTMKKAMIYSGTFAAIGFLFGMFFKVMHWPGASILLVSAMITIGFVFLPLMSILRTRELNSTSEKTVIITGTLTGILYCLSVLFAVMHWPGSRTGVMWIVTTGFALLIFIPVYFFNGIRKPETKTNTIISTILLVVVSGLHFTMVDLRPANPEVKMYSYVQSEKLLELMRSESGKTHRVNPENDKLATYIQNTCNQIKGLILQADIGETTLPEDFESKKIVINERRVGPDFDNHGTGIRLLGNLKTAVISYNQSQKTGNKSLIPVTHSILDIEPEKVCSYTNLFILNGITQLQMYLANSENSVLAYAQ